MAMKERCSAYSDLFQGKLVDLADFSRESYLAKRQMGMLFKEGSIVGQNCFTGIAGKRKIIVWMPEYANREPKSKEVLLGILMDFVLKGD